MPPKIRELIAILESVGFENQGGRGVFYSENLVKQNAQFNYYRHEWKYF